MTEMNKVIAFSFLFSLCVTACACMWTLQFKLKLYTLKLSMVGLAQFLMVTTWGQLEL